MTWADTYDHAVKAFNGETPNAATEAEIIDHYEQRPERVTRAIDHIAQKLEQGTIRTGWGVLRRELAQDAERASISPSSNQPDRDRAIQRAEQWIRAAGIHYDQADEITDELFGDTGRLRQWNTDQQLHDRMLKHWAAERPRGQAVETEREQWYEQRRKHLGTDSETIPF